MATRELEVIKETTGCTCGCGMVQEVSNEPQKVESGCGCGCSEFGCNCGCGAAN